MSTDQKDDLEKLISLAEDVASKIEYLDRRRFSMNMVSAFSLVLFISVVIGTIVSIYVYGYQYIWLTVAGLLISTAMFCSFFYLYLIEKKILIQAKVERGNLEYLLTIISDAQNSWAFEGESELSKALLNMRLNRIRFGLD